MRAPELQKQYIAQTVRSIARQSCSDWILVIVANTGTDLPALPDGVIVQRVDFPPNRMHNGPDLTFEQRMAAVRIDKGRRCHAAMAHIEASDYTMIVDDDDFVNINVVERTLSENPDFGYFFDSGYLWNTDGKFLFPTLNFYLKCGTSHVIKSSLYRQLRQRFDDEAKYIRETFGAHIFIKRMLDGISAPMQPYPGPGAVKRFAHAGSHGIQTRKNILAVSLAGNGYRPTRPDRVLSHFGRIRMTAQHGARFGMDVDGK